MKRNVLTLLFAAATIAVSAQDLTGSWNGKLSFDDYMELDLVLNIKHDAQNKTVCTLDCPDRGATNVETVVYHASADSLSISVPSASVTYDAALHGDTLRGTFSYMGTELPLNFVRKKAEQDNPQASSLIPRSTITDLRESQQQELI